MLNLIIFSILFSTSPIFFMTIVEEEVLTSDSNAATATDSEIEFGSEESTQALEYYKKYIGYEGDIPPTSPLFGNLSNILNFFAKEYKNEKELQKYDLFLMKKNSADSDLLTCVIIENSNDTRHQVSVPLSLLIFPATEKTASQFQALLYILAFEKMIASVEKYSKEYAFLASEKPCKVDDFTAIFKFTKAVLVCGSSNIDLEVANKCKQKTLEPRLKNSYIIVIPLEQKFNSFMDAHLIKKMFKYTIDKEFREKLERSINEKLAEEFEEKSELEKKYVNTKNKLQKITKKHSSVIGTSLGVVLALGSHLPKILIFRLAPLKYSIPAIIGQQFLNYVIFIKLMSEERINLVLSYLTITTVGSLIALHKLAKKVS